LRAKRGNPAFLCHPDRAVATRDLALRSNDKTGVCVETWIPTLDKSEAPNKKFQMNSPGSPQGFIWQFFQIKSQAKSRDLIRATSEC